MGENVGLAEALMIASENVITPSPSPHSASFQERITGPLLVLLGAFFYSLGICIQRNALIKEVAQSEAVRRASLASTEFSSQLQQASCYKRYYWTLVWCFGMFVYTVGNGIYTVALLYSTLSLCTSLFCVVLIYNGILGYFLLGERMSKTDIAGCFTIIVGVLVTCNFISAEVIHYDSGLLVESAEKPLAIIYFLIVLVLVVFFSSSLFVFEKRFPTFGFKETEDTIEDRRNSTSSCTSNQPYASGSPLMENGVTSKQPSNTEYTKALIFYPALCAMFESFVQILLKAWSSMLDDTFFHVHFHYLFQFLFFQFYFS